MCETCRKHFVNLQVDRVSHYINVIIEGVVGIYVTSVETVSYHFQNQVWFWFCYIIPGNIMTDDRERAALFIPTNYSKRL
jgi:hypothetical protein